MKASTTAVVIPRQRRFAKLFVSLLATLGIVFAGVVANPVAANAANSQYPDGQCTDYVWKIVKKELNNEMPWFSGDSGNAKNWLQSAKNHNIPTGTTAKPKSIVVYSNSGYGHVAYVTSVSGSTMHIKEGNYAGLREHEDNVPSGLGTTRPWTSDVIIGFIYPVDKTINNNVNNLKEVTPPIGMYTLTPKSVSGDRLDLAGAAAGNGVAIQRYKANGSVAQQWYIQSWNGYFIRSAQTGTVLDVTGGQFKDGTNIQSYSLGDTKNQRWKFYNAGSGYYTICAAANKNLCLDVTPNRSRAQLRNYTKGNANQMWKITGLSENVAPGVYVLEALNETNSRLDVASESKSSGGNVRISPANGHDSQAWAITKGSDGWYNLQNVNSGMNLDVQGGGSSYVNGQNVQQWTPGTQDAQKWRFQKAPAGYYVAAHKNGTYLSVQEYAGGANAQLWTLASNNRQQFKVIRIADPITPGKYRIVPKVAQDKRLRAVGSGAGANVEIRTASNSSCEYKWTLVPTNANNTEFHIKNECGGFLMDVHNNGTANGTNVGVWNDNGNDAQKFTFQRAGDGYYWIRATNGMYLDVAGGKTDDGTNIQVWNFYTTNNQKFRLEPVIEKVSSVKVTGSSSVQVGKTVTLKAAVLPSDASNKAVTWSSSNTAVATVNSKGVVTGKKAGVVTITATAKDGSKKSGSLKITVKAAPTPKPKPSPSGSVSKTVTMLRLYNKATGEHFYTSDVYERNALVKKHGWTYEGVAWIAPKKSSAPVYRLYNKVSGDHHYTMSFVEMNALVSRHGWTYEGVGWYSDTSERVKVYRAYNPRLRVGSHHYTTDVNEYRALYTKHGWRAENTAWYAVRIK